MWRKSTWLPFELPLGYLLVLAVALFCTSCSGGLHPVRGKVLYHDKPIKNAVVTFHPKGVDDNANVLRPSGITDENGVFTLSTQKDSGATPGEYEVTIVWLEEIAPPKKPIGTEAPPPPPDRLDGRYATTAKSKLTATIKRGANELEPFDLK